MKQARCSRKGPLSQAGIPLRILNTAGAPLTVVEVDREFGRYRYPDDYRPSNEELVQMLQIRSDCWCDVLRAGLPAGHSVGAIRAWLIKNGWAVKPVVHAPKGKRRDDLL